MHTIKGRRNGLSSVRMSTDSPMIPDVRIDPTRWYAYSRTCPGMTNRVVENRWPDQVLPYGNMATDQEIEGTYARQSQPMAWIKGEYLQIAIFASVLAVAYYVMK